MTKLFQLKLDHVIFWILTIGFHAYTSSTLIGAYNFDVYLLEVLVRNSLLAVVIYLNLFATIALFDRKQILIDILLLIGSLLAYSLTKSYYNYILYGQDPFELNSLFYNFSIVSFYLGFCFALYFTKQWHLQREQLRRIEVEKLNTELEYLKSQMNPHFLFNSINTIYFQIDKNNTVARETLSRFSEMLRYQLYECNGMEIPIEKELSYLTNYVELQRMRKDENYEIEFNHADSLAQFAIPPLLLIPFIENAFKHVSHFNNGSNKIKIDLNRTDNTFKLHVFNTKDSYSKENQNGIGLKNARRRLELLYPKDHTIKIVDESNSFEVHVEFKISHNQTTT
jgi:sensor histidine kinase YesM